VEHRPENETVQFERERSAAGLTVDEVVCRGDRSREATHGVSKHNLSDWTVGRSLFLGRWSLIGSCVACRHLRARLEPADKRATDYVEHPRNRGLATVPFIVALASAAVDTSSLSGAGVLMRAHAEQAGCIRAVTTSAEACEAWLEQ
jgi:hypothetical protein